MKLSWKIAAMCTLLIALAAVALAEGGGTLVVPADVTVIEQEAFAGLQDVERIELPSGITEIGPRAFADSTVREIYVPSTVVRIADDALEGSPDARFVSDDALWYGTFKYAVDGDHVVLKKYMGASSSVTPPARIDGLPVTTIGWGCFSGNDRLTKAVIPEGVARIEDHAFTNCTSLTDITFPSTLKTLSTKVFVNCGANATTPFYFVLPDDMEDLVGRNGGANTFEDCNAVLVCGKTSATAALLTDRNYVYTVPGEYDFRYRYELESDTGARRLWLIGYVGTGTTANIPKGPYGIKRFSADTTSTNWRTYYGDAFYGNETVRKVVIPEGVTRIESGAFSGCLALTDITFPSTLKYLAQQTFINCGANATAPFYFVLPDDMEDMVGRNGGANTFEGCNAVLVCGKYSDTAKLLTARNYTYTVPGEYDFRYRYRAFTEDGETVYRLYLVGYVGTSAEVTIPEGIYAITRYQWDPPYGAYDPSFYGNETIEKVVIPEGTVLIGDSAFMECTMLWDITLPSTIKTIENHAFQHTGHSSGKRPIVALPRGITAFTANNDAGWACFNESAAVLVAPAGSYVATELYENWWVYYNTVADAEAGVNLRYKPNDDPDFEWNGNR